MRLFSIALAAMALNLLAAPAFAGFTPYRDPNCAAESESDCTRMLPKLPKFTGWHEELEASHLVGASTIVPDGFNYDQARVTISIRATPKIEVEYDVKSVADMIRREHEEAERDWPGTIFADTPVLKSGDGQTLKSQIATPPPDGWWHRYAYGEEGGYYIRFEISAKEKSDFDANMKEFERFVAAYKAKLK